MKRVVYHRLAASELIKAGVFYEKRRPWLGEAFLKAVDAIRDRIRENPARGRPEVAGLRSLKVRRFPYRLFYEDQPDVCGSWPWLTWRGGLDTGADALSKDIGKRHRHVAIMPFDFVDFDVKLAEKPRKFYRVRQP
jgi:hypothetical protein